MMTMRLAVAVLAGLGVALGAATAFGQAKKEEKKQTVTSKVSAADKFQEGLAHERGGRDAEAFEAFLQAGEAGHGPAQRKLATIYDRGNRVINRDYMSAIRWYERARVQGVELPKPLPPIKGR
jgi:TPR repeat protein